MKKIPLLCSLLILLAMSIHVMAAGDEIYLNENYDTYATGSEPVGVTVKGGSNSHVVMYPVAGNKMNKALMLHDNDEGFVSANWALSQAVKKCFIQFSAKFDELDGGKIVLYDSQKTPYDLFTVTKSGDLCTSEGKQINVGFTKNPTDIGVFINVDTKRINVYVNGKCCLSKYYSGKCTLTQIKEIQLNLYPDGKSEHSYYINYMKCYNAYKAKKIPDGAYNSTTVEFVPLENKTERTEYFNVDCESGTLVPLSIVDKGNNYNINEEDGNKYLQVDAFQSDSYIEKQFSQGQVADTSILEMDVKIDKIKRPVYLFSALYFTGVVGTINEVYLAADNTLRAADGTMIAELKADKWYNFAMKYRFSRGTFDFYVDGELKLQNHDLITKSDSMRILRIYMPASLDSTINIKLDNIKMYSGKTLMRFDTPENKEENNTAEDDKTPSDTINEGNIEYIPEDNKDNTENDDDSSGTEDNTEDVLRSDR